MTGGESRITFADGKAPDALRTIGEVARALGIRQHVLRYWEEQFPTLRPVKRSGGRRYYRPDDVNLIAAIDRLVHTEGYTLRGARLALETGGGPAKNGGDAKNGGPVISGRVEERAPASNGRLVARLSAIRAELAEALGNS
jgi:DNA-binding transcriptional MerR regulator